MFKFLDRTKNTLRDWSHKHSKGKNAKFWLAVFSFSEASFFIIPPDVFLLAILINQGHRWLYYAFLTTTFSVLGALLGYVFGFFFFDWVGEFLIDTYSLQSQMQTVSLLFQQNAFWSIFVSAFTPIPFKVFTISAGFFHINIFVFFIASLLGRGLRFLSVAYLVKLFGRQMAQYTYRYFNYLTLVILLIIALVIFI